MVYLSGRSDFKPRRNNCAAHPADEIGNLERRRGHWGTSSSNVTHTYIKAAGRSLLRSSCAASAAGRLRPNAVVFTDIPAVAHAVCIFHYQTPVAA